MLSKLSEGDKNSELIINKYRQYIDLSRKLAHILLTRFVSAEVLQTVSRLMGVMRGKGIMLESKEEKKFIADFSLFEHQINGENCFQRYQAENHELDAKEAEMLKASLLSYTSLFKIIETDPVNASVTLSDLLSNKQEIKIININLSQTARPGLLIFTRIVPFSDFNMASGMFCMFSKNSERALLKQLKPEMKKVKSEIESVQRFIAFFKLNRKQGLATTTTDI